MVLQNSTKPYDVGVGQSCRQSEQCVWLPTTMTSLINVFVEDGYNTRLVRNACPATACCWTSMTNGSRQSPNLRNHLRQKGKTTFDYDGTLGVWVLWHGGDVINGL